MKNVTIDVSPRAKGVALGMFQVAFLLILRERKSASIAEIRDSMITVLKEPVDSAPIYLTVKRLLERATPLIREVGAEKEGSQRRVALTKAGDEAAQAGLDTMSKIVKAFS